MLIVTPYRVGPRSTPGKPPGLVWCNSLLSLVLFRYVTPSLARSGGVPLAILLLEEPVISRLLGRNR
jgi:hypothetical protein